jgi:hypothetical protein
MANSIATTSIREPAKIWTMGGNRYHLDHSLVSILWKDLDSRPAPISEGAITEMAEIIRQQVELLADHFIGAIPTDE